MDVFKIYLTGVFSDIVNIFPSQKPFNSKKKFKIKSGQDFRLRKYINQKMVRKSPEIWFFPFLELSVCQARKSDFCQLGGQSFKYEPWKVELLS